MNKVYEKLIKTLGKNRVKIDEPMAKHTTFKIGGPADLFYEAKTEEELVGALGVVRELGVPFFILGGGSNVLVGDKGFKGMVIKVQSSKFKVQSYGSKFKIIVGAGMQLNKLVSKAAECFAVGLEFLAGIPGTIGGAIRGNAGAWGQDIGGLVKRVKVLGGEGKVFWLTASKCRFTYRESRFKHSGEIILAAELALKRGKKEEIEEQTEVNLKKRSCQPKEPSAGCIFVNPKPQATGYFIEQAGLKGTKVGGAIVSERHANFIVNLGGAKAKDVITLINLVKKKVKEKFGIDLEEEIVRIGEF